MAALSNEDLAKLVELLSKMDELGTESSRRDVLVAAGLHDLLPRLDLAGSPMVATNRLVGDLDPLSLKQLIVWAKTQTGIEQQQLLDGIAQRILSPATPRTDAAPEPHGGAAKPTIVKLELDMKGAIGTFSPEAFKRELTRLLGAQVDAVRITSIQPGSIRITLEGDPQALATLVDRLQQSDAAARRFARATGLVTVTYTAGGHEHVVRVGAGLSSAAIIAIVIVGTVALALATWRLWPASPTRSSPGDAVHVPVPAPTDAPTALDAVELAVPADVAPDEITIHVESNPAGAEIRLDGATLGTTPLTKQLPRGTNRRAKLLATKRGFIADVQYVDATVDIDKRIELRRPGTARVVKEADRRVLFRLDGDEPTAVAAAKDYMTKKCKLSTELERPRAGEIVLRCGGAIRDRDLIGFWRDTSRDPKTMTGGVTFADRGSIRIHDPIEPASCLGTYTFKPVDANHATVTVTAPRGCPGPKNVLDVSWGADDRWHAGTFVKQ